MEFRYVQKEEITGILPAMFDLLYGNMNSMIPDGRPKEEQRAEWLGQVGPALMGEKRRLCLMRQGETVAGFFWYYIRDGVMMMEEIQLRKEYQGMGLFRCFFRWLMKGISADVDVVEAYAHRKNHKSQSILEYLGLNAVPDTVGDEYILYRGSFAYMKEKINQKKEEKKEWINCF